MNFDFSPEQYFMKDSSEGLLRQIAGPSLARVAYEARGAVTERLRGPLAEHGLLGGAIPSEFGGTDLDLVDFAMVFEAAGATLLPYPLKETFVTAALWQAAAGPEPAERLAAIADGSRMVTVAWGSRHRPWSVQGVTAAIRPDGAVLTGTRTFVPFGEVADWIMVPALVETNPHTLLALVDARAPGVHLRPLETLDGSYPLAEIHLDRVFVPTIALIEGDGSIWTKALTLGRVISAQEALGVAEQVFRETLDYVKVREQFGFPVGRFQAVKHLAADDYLMVESARVANRYAIWSVTADQDAALYAALAKAYSGEMAKRVSGDAIQLHGGIGYTWDSDVHLYFKRAWRIFSELGTSQELRESMARHVIDGMPAAFEEEARDQ